MHISKHSMYGLMLENTTGRPVKEMVEMWGFREMEITAGKKPEWK